MNAKMNEQELIRRLGELPAEIEPRSDPWPSILARIESAGRAGRERRGPWLPRAAAAAVVLALAAGLLLAPMLQQDRPAPVRSVAGPAESLRLTGNLAVSEAEYQAAFREFIPVGDARPSLPRKTVEMIELGWADLIAMENMLGAALQANPEDPFLNSRMQELRARQLGFLKSMARLDRNNRRMTL